MRRILIWVFLSLIVYLSGFLGFSRHNEALSAKTKPIKTIVRSGHTFQTTIRQAPDTRFKNVFR